MRSDRPRAITIFLTNGNPTGIKKLEVSNRTIRSYVIPRLNLADASKYDELKQPALYLLFDQEQTKAYIGECENFYKRIKEHDAKEFWDVAVAFIDTNNNLDKGSVKYLESMAVEASRNAGRIATDNKTIPPRNNLHEFKIPIVEEFFDDIKLLTSTLGYILFDQVKTHGLDEDDYWYCRGRNTSAKGVYSTEGFTVLAGSIIDAVGVPSFAKNFPNEAAKRLERIKDYAEPVSDTAYKLIQDIPFRSVSAAGGFCLGRASNGWMDWKNSAGKTLDEIIRQNK
jgi:hypothetical protein